MSGFPGKTEPESSLSSGYHGISDSPDPDPDEEREFSSLGEGEQKASLPSVIVPNERPSSAYDYDADNNSCSSTPLSVEISDVYSTDGKQVGSGSGRSNIKPPVPSIIGSHR